MSRSSAPDCRPAGDRARLETVPGLVALAVVVAAVSLYAGVLVDAVPGSDRDAADPTLVAVHDRVATGGVVDPERVANATLPTPDGYLLNVTVTVDDRQWRRGPVPPTSAVDAAGRSTAVRVAPARIRPGRLRVVVW